MGRRDWTAAYEKLEREGRCRVAGCEGWPLDPAHIAPRSLGGGQSADAILPLCREHHRAYDSHRLDLLPLLSPAEQVEAVRILGLARAYRRLSGET